MREALELESQSGARIPHSPRTARALGEIGLAVQSDAEVLYHGDRESVRQGVTEATAECARQIHARLADRRAVGARAHVPESGHARVTLEELSLIHI